MKIMDSFIDYDGEICEKQMSQRMSPSFSVTDKIGAPVVYKLVRVEGDGRLVPATDDEIMVVKGLLEDDENGLHLADGTKKNLGCISNGALSSVISQLENSEVQNEDKLNWQIECAKETLERAKQEEKLCFTYGSSDHSVCGTPDRQNWNYHNIWTGNGKPQSEAHAHEALHSKSSLCSGSKFDISTLKGEMCLDNLSIKELQKTFNATIGRETRVKDKMWLKRRITMGLTNPCDACTMSFLARDSELAKYGQENLYDISRVSKGITGKEMDNVDCKYLEAGAVNYVQGLKKGDHYSSSLEKNKAVKRVRKPTRRYIEEVSGVESKDHGGKCLNFDGFGYEKLSPTPKVKYVQGLPSGGRTVVTRIDSLSGSGIQIPCVSRVRRSRPRQNLSALLEFIAHKEDGTVEENFRKCTGINMAKRRGRCIKLNRVDSRGRGLNKFHVAGDASKLGVRRKHHRAWTLTEIMKLIDGVSKYGVGKWSEIKRLSFAPYSYRTSVDLKDKWRNLLKSSFNQSPSNEGGKGSTRKHAPTAIPSSILSRVRELAGKQLSVPPVSRIGPEVSSGSDQFYHCK